MEKIKDAIGEYWCQVSQVFCFQSCFLIMENMVSVAVQDNFSNNAFLLQKPGWRNW